MKPSKTIILVRHGTTAYNESDILQGRIDNPLNKTGEQEAWLLAEELKDEAFDIIFHSPLKRAVQTAEIINSKHKKDLIPMPGFVEIDLGDWEGLKYQEAIKQDPEFYIQWKGNSDVPFPNGENFTQVFDRVKPVVTEIISSAYSNILVVGHAAVNRAFLGNLIFMEPQASRTFRMNNCAFSRFFYYKNKHQEFAVVESWNNTYFLKEKK